jgi:hypothetical protein
MIWARVSRVRPRGPAVGGFISGAILMVAIPGVLHAPDIAGSLDIAVRLTA